MVSKSIAFTFVVVAFYATLLFEVQSLSYLFDANDDEKQLCLEKANGRNLESAKKMRPISCNVRCQYDDGETETVNLPDGQLCCDFGVAPTGCCSNGTCQVGVGACRFG